MSRIPNLTFLRHNLSILLKRNIMTTQMRAEKAMEKLKTNSYFEKYADKIAKLQQTSPEEFLSRLEQHEEKKTKKTSNKPEKERQYAQLLNPKKQVENTETNYEPLEKIMKLDLIADKNKEEIEEIWKEYHMEKDYISAVIPLQDYEEITENSLKHPTFLFPLPRTQGYEFVMCQFDKNAVHFTPLLYYQVHKENAPECLTIIHYTELKDKGIVLMRGEYDKNVLDHKEAQCLANQLQLYYKSPDASKRRLLDTFTAKPDEFKHMDLIAQIENLSI